MASLTGVATCQICEREYSEEPDLVPRILANCGHTLCTECAGRIATGNFLACPFDRTKTTVADGNVRNLKKNFSILQIKEDEQFKRKQRLNKKHAKKTRHNDGTCDENPAHEASSFCKSCDADLCDECWDYVHSLSILAHHEKLALFLNTPIDVPECSDHPGEKAEFVCKVDKCRLMQTRLMCHECFREGSSHQGHGYVTIQAEVAEIRTKIRDSVHVAEAKEAAIVKNIESIESVKDSYSVEGAVFREKSSEMKRFRFFDKETEKLAMKSFEKAVKERIEQLNQKIANQRADLDWIKKNKMGIKRLAALPNTNLVEKRCQVDLNMNKVEGARIRHPNTLATFHMCIVHVPSLSPLTVQIRPAHRLEIRESYHNNVSNFIEQNTSLVSSNNNLLRYKNHFLRLIERTDDTKSYSEGLSLILVVDPFNGDRDRQFVALELLENAPAYEKIIVGLNPFNFQVITTFLAKLVDVSHKDRRVKIVYINDPEKDIEKMVDLALKV